MRKIISIILIALMIIGTIILPNKAYANFSIDSASLYSKGLYEGYLRYGNTGIIFNYVVYSKDGKEYPAYCLNKDLDGVTSEVSYSVSTEEALTNVKVWRAIINGYPYKTAAELGCNTDEEAFIATKQAVYAMLYDRDVEEYNAQDERQERVLKALTKIVTDARNSTEIKQSSNLEIKEVTETWSVDSINKKYISKEYSVLANAPINNFNVSIQNNIIDGIIIVDKDNDEKKDFKSNENFKVLVPIANLKTQGDFKIKVEGQVATKPVLYGYSEDRNMQDYAITGNIYEDGTGTKTVYYTENETKIIILKTNDEGEALEGVKFNLLNENKEVVYSDLTTNVDGKIIIKNLEPGKYYVKETSTLNGYEVYGEAIEVNLNYNEEFTVKVTNSKEVVEIEKPEIIENQKEVVAKLPKTGM